MEVKEKVRKTEDKWFSSGDKVIHSDTNRSMMVDRVLYKTVNYKDGNSKRFTLGVECHWVDDSGKYQTGKFHTRELRK